VTGHAAAHIQHWLRDFVIGLNLCPFASPLLGAPNLRTVICEASDRAELHRGFLEELDLLQSSTEQEVATTLLAFPNALQEFEDFLFFLDEAQDLLTDSGLEGIVQLASFHPGYRFAGEAPDAASHFTNRAPYPIIHLLRENMVSRSLEDFPDPARIPDRNIETLNKLGVPELERRWKALFSE
jgi:hypothetical protein